MTVWSVGKLTKVLLVFGFKYWNWNGLLCCGACLVGGKTDESYADFWFSRNGVGFLLVFCSIFLG